MPFPILAAAGFSALGSLMGGFGARAAGKARKRSAYEAARQTRQEAAIEGAALADEGERAAAAAAVRGAGAGGGWEGSAMDVLRDQEQRSQFNVRSAIWSGNTRAAALEHEGDVADHEGKVALISSVIEAGSSLAGGWARNAQLGRQAALRSSLRSLRRG